MKQKDNMNSEDYNNQHSITIHDWYLNGICIQYLTIMTLCGLSNGSVAILSADS